MIYSIYLSKKQKFNYTSYDTCQLHNILIDIVCHIYFRYDSSLLCDVIDNELNSTIQINQFK